MSMRVYKEHRTLLSYIADSYFLALNYLFRYSHSTTPAECSKLQTHASYCRFVEEAFERLDEEDKLFINNDFFHNAYADWWEDMYSSSSYYRIMGKAMSNFLKEMAYV